jgi:hypothetical protein
VILRIVYFNSSRAAAQYSIQLPGDQARNAHIELRAMVYAGAVFIVAAEFR